jgi:ferredoxin-NADP reductase
MRFIDNVLNKITMYRLVLYVLMVIWSVAVVFGLLKILPYSPLDLVFSLIVIQGVSWLTNVIFARVFGAIPNIESFLITGFILALIVDPVSLTSVSGIGFIAVVSALAMASKYLLAWRKKHLFNPAALGIAAGALLLGHYASWWVGGNLPLMAFVVIGGLLIVRKLRRFPLVLTFLLVACLTIVLTKPGSNPLTVLEQTALHTPIFFLAFVMLTEPLTMPATRGLRLCYAALVGVLFAPNVHIGGYYFTPEVALLAGNLFTFFVSPKGRFMLTLVEKRELAKNTYEFVFTPDRKIAFTPGQYIEWTLPADGADNRGNRRLFTIASSPTESGVHLGIRYYSPSSTFKTKLLALAIGETITAAQISGDFTLPTDHRKKLAFIAGGIGITPFRSQIEYLIATNDTRDMTLLYSNKTVEEIAYRDLFTRAEAAVGLKTVYAVTDEPNPVPGMHGGFIDENLIRARVPDYAQRLFYISGPQGMVDAFTTLLRSMGVSPFNIHTDYFPGF